VSQYPDLCEALDGLFRAFPIDVRRGQAATFRTCPACQGAAVEFDDDTDPAMTGLNVKHEAACPWLRASRALYVHEVPFFERADLVDIVVRLLARDLPHVKDRTARAILAALDVRIRYRQPEKKT
jgi:hypothetical protein